MNISKAMKAVILFTILPLVMATSTIAKASELDNDNTHEVTQSKHQHKGKFSQGDKMHRMFKKLNLSMEQKQQIALIKLEGKAESTAIHDSYKQYKEEQKVLLQADTFNEGAFTNSYYNNQETFAKAALIKAKTKHAIFNVLTPEQQEKWQGMMKRHHNK